MRALTPPLLLIAALLFAEGVYSASVDVSQKQVSQKQASQKPVSPEQTSQEQNEINVSPYQRVVEGTQELLAIAATAQDYYQNDPDRYYHQVDEFVGRMVDVERFTRGVMAKYASAARYRALTDKEEQQAFRQRIDHFGKILRRDLIQLYAKALIGFDGKRIETLQPNADSDDDRFAIIEQRVYDNSGKPHRIHYYLHKKPDEPWLLYNIAVDGVNIGNLFRSQFADAAEKKAGDLDSVIEEWSQDQYQVTSETP